MSDYAVETHINTRLSAASTQVENLTAEEQRLLGLLQDTREALARAREQEEAARRAGERVRAGGGRLAVAPETLRRAVRELGTFTVSELAAELGCTQATAKKRLDAMAVSKPPWVRPAGRAMGKAIYEYVKPTEPGNAFTAQQRLREQVTPEQQALAMARPERVEPSAIRQSHIGSVNTKELRAVVREAVALGWRLEHTGGSGHSLRLTKGTRRINIPSTPRNAGATAAQLRQKLFETSSRQFLREASHAGR